MIAEKKILSSEFFLFSPFPIRNVECAQNHGRFRAAPHYVECGAECGLKRKSQKIRIPELEIAGPMGFPRNALAFGPGNA